MTSFYVCIFALSFLSALFYTVIVNMKWKKLRASVKENISDLAYDARRLDENLSIIINKQDR